MENLKQNMFSFKNSLYSILHQLDNLEKENVRLKTDFTNLTLFAKTRKLNVCNEKDLKDKKDCLEEDEFLCGEDLSDYSQIQNSSVEMNINLKKNVIDNKKTQRIYLK